MLRDLNPRHSLVAGIIWLMVALAASFAIAASIWAGRVAREIVVQQHVRRLVLETDQLGSDLGQAVSMRLEAIHAVGGSLPLEVFKRLSTAYPDLAWVAVADTAGVVMAGAGSENSIDPLSAGDNVAATGWFSEGLHRPWIGVIGKSRSASSAPLLGDLAAPVRDDSGRVVGVIAAHLT